MDPRLLIGTLGLVVLLVGFIVEHLGASKGRRFYFNLFNMIGSVLLGIYAVLIGNIIFIILEFVWAGFSMWYLIRKE